MTHQSAHLDRIERQNLDNAIEDITLQRKTSQCSDQRPRKLTDPEAASQEAEVTPDQKRQKLLLQCVLLEVGILFHSVFIGMALAVATGSDFIVLLLAIIFHQTFEGVSSPPLHSFPLVPPQIPILY
jgi:zinc transporter ZupT